MTFPRTIAVALLFIVSTVAANAQQKPTILSGADLTRVVPAGFYFQGLSAPTQMRNAGAARFGTNRHVIAGMVDTSGYAAEVKARYEGFLITDSEVMINGQTLRTGAYGFGFSNEGKFTVMDLGGNEVLSVSGAADSALKRPRPLMMSVDAQGVRLYNGRNYVTISAN